MPPDSTFSGNSSPAHHPGPISAAVEYLRSNFFTLDELAVHSGASADRLSELIQAGCMPPHSHEVSLEIVYKTSLWGQKSEQEIARYYPHSLVGWAKTADRLAHVSSPQDAAREVQQRFFAELRASLQSVRGAREAFPACFSAEGNIVEAVFAEWRDVRFGYLMDGTWGICLREISARNIVRKGVALFMLRQYLDDPDSALSREEIEHALAEYDAVAALFLPFERPGSTRTKVFGAARERFLAAVDERIPLAG